VPALTKRPGGKDADACVRRKKSMRCLGKAFVSAVEADRMPPVSPTLAGVTPTLAMLNIEPPEPKNSGSNADDPINLAHLLGMLHIVDLIC
jgi:hypothetical protein